MSQSVKCWMPDDGDEEDGHSVEAYDARSAAEKFVSHVWEAVDGMSAYDVMTRDSFGVVRQFKVRVEAEPVFVAAEVRAPSPNRGEGGAP